MGRVVWIIVAAVVGIVGFGGGYLVSRAIVPRLPYATPTIALNGDVSVPAFVLPPSQYMSQEARNFLMLRAAVPMSAPSGNESIADTRRNLTSTMSVIVSGMEDAYPTNMAEETIGGVPVRIFTPKDRAADPDRVLINVHGGAFSMCWESCSTLESAPIAAVGGYRVVSVNYRMAPEARHPAGVEDVASVYRALLENYEPGQIGIYGCSAGGVLAAQAAAWFPAHDLPQAGAIGIFGAGAVPFQTGDSAYVSAFIDGGFPPPNRPGQPEGPDLSRGYFGDADMSDATISPGFHLDVLRRFPPTMITTGTRAMDMSPAVYTNAQLLKAGVQTTFLVGEGMGHCYMYFSGFPEAHDAYAAISNFFRSNLR